MSVAFLGDIRRNEKECWRCFKCWTDDNRCIIYFLRNRVFWSFFWLTKNTSINKWEKFLPVHSTNPPVLRFYHSWKREDRAMNNLFVYDLQKKKGLSRLFPHWLHCFHFFALGLWERDGGALVGERVRLPVDQPAAVRPPRRADGLGRTPGFLTLRPLPNRQWETKLQVTPLVWTKEGDNCFFQAKEFLNCSLIFCTTC